MRARSTDGNENPMSKQKFGYLLATLLMFGFLPLPATAEKSDVVVLINGNSVTGEVKSLEFASLRYSTDSMGTVNIDWEDIVSVTSNQKLQIETTDGSRYFGSLSAPDERFVVRIKTVSQELTFPAKEIVRITPIETAERFWQRLDGEFSLGFRTEKGTDVTTSNVNANVAYRTLKYLVGLELSSSVTDQPLTEDAAGETTGGTTARQYIETNYQRFRPNRWFTDWYTRWEKNDETGINARMSIGGAIGHYLVQTNNSQLSLAAGLQAARTSPIGEDESTTQAEGRIEIHYLRRKLLPESSLSFTSKIYPLIEDLSEYRAETDVTFKREFFDDFFLDLTLGHSYISSPPTDASSTDYTVTTSLGYSF